MTSTLQQGTANYSDTRDYARLAEVRPRPVKVRNDMLEDEPSFGRRASRALLRFVITLGIGIGGTLAWQAWGDTARQMTAKAFPAQFGWIAPPAATAALAPKSASAAPAAPAAPSIDPQQLNAMSADIAAMKQSVEQLAAQVAANQQQMSDELAKLQAAEHDILAKIPTPPPRPAPAPVRRPPPAAAAAPTLPPPPQVR
jgi:hypothetical protein